MKTFYWNLILSCIICAITISPVNAEDDIVDTAVKAGSFKTLVAAVQAADLVDTLKGEGPFTVFAPTDDAFSKVPKETLQNLLKPENKGLLTSILTYHVLPAKAKAKLVTGLKNAKTANGQRVNIKVSDKGVMLNNAQIVKTDIECSNGVIHVIDAVIMPETKTIPEIAIQAGSFKTLVAAAKEAGLVDALSSKGPFTVFAPTDEAFAKLPKGTVESLLKPENKNKLAAILKYHVVPGRVYSDAVTKIDSADSLEGSKLKFSAKDGVLVNDAKVIKADIDTANGVIHVIDSVLIPPMSKTSAIQMLQNAVAVGAKMYNNGHHQRCADIYADTLQKMMSESISGMSDHDVSAVKHAMNTANHEHHAGRRAWILRHGIDRMYTQLSR